MKFLKSLSPTKDSRKPVDYSWSSFGRKRETINRDLPSREGDQPKSKIKAQVRRSALKQKKPRMSATIPIDERSGVISTCSDNSTESSVSTSPPGDSPLGDTPDLEECDHQRSNSNDDQDNFGEFSHYDSAESCFGSFHEGSDSQMEDDRDESQVNSQVEVESRQCLVEGRGQRDDTEDIIACVTPPRPASSDNEAHDSSLTQLSSFTRTRTKASTLRDIRRTQSNDSKNYVHVFHGQLHTLAEERDCDDESIIADDCDSDRDDFGKGAVHMQHSFSESLDDEKLRDRWNYSKELMNNMGNK